VKLQEIKETLSTHRLRLTQSLGQNFLHDRNQLRRIAEAADLVSGDQVLEIGPGLGALTQSLIEKGAVVLAVEKDHRLYELLENRCGDCANLTLAHEDALAYLRNRRQDWSHWKLVSNLPYSVASPILVEMAQANGCPKRMVATVQWEVARRLVASAGDPDYGLLTLLIRLRYDAAGWFKIPATCFFPVPKVDSACVTLVRRREPLLSPDQAETFERIVKRGFSQRRKVMLKLLKTDWPVDRLTQAYRELGLAPDVRGEKVSLEQFVELTRRLHLPQL
jgi:16S rRNA (adenine1518-N6/adenine1519-N6)-dimethyltransferase